MLDRDTHDTIRASACPGKRGWPRDGGETRAGTRYPSAPMSVQSTPRYGCQTMVAPLRRVLVRRPDEAFGAADPVRWHYTSRVDLREAQREHDALVDLLR